MRLFRGVQLAQLKNLNEGNVQIAVENTIQSIILAYYQTLVQQEQLQASMILQVHDELVFDVPQAELQLLQTHIPAMMRDALPLAVPIELSVKVGENWLKAH